MKISNCLTTFILVTVMSSSATAFPQGLANLLLTLRGSVFPNAPALSDLTRFKSFSCVGREDGTYPDFHSRCSNYYRCLGGRVFSYVCPPGTSFDQEEDECLPSKNVTCPREPPSTERCLHQSDGFYPDYSTNCQSYFRCKDERVVATGECNRGTIWDFSTSSCWSSQRASCSAPSCLGLSDGPHPMAGSKCTAYFTCKDGFRTDHLCPLGSSFDYLEKKCVVSSKSVCYEQVCEGRVNGIHALSDSPCSSYFRCFNAALVEIEECPPQHIFDGYECVRSTNFSCWSDIDGSCSERPDGVYHGDDGECRSFYLCRQSKQVRSFRCSSGLVFNGEKCVDSQNYICSSRPRVPDCSNKQDGYYILDKTECRSFYHCEKGAKLSEHNCPGDFVFNGKQCVDSLLYSCSNKEIDQPVASRRTRFTRKTGECSYVTDGFQISRSSKCSQFYACSNGKKVSSHKCPEGLIFSGSQCVPQETFRCPISPNSRSCSLGDGSFYERNDITDYFFCSNGLKTSFRCPVGMKFDGLRCVKTNEIQYEPRWSLQNNWRQRFYDGKRYPDGYQ